MNTYVLFIHIIFEIFLYCRIFHLSSLSLNSRQNFGDEKDWYLEIR